MIQLAETTHTGLDRLVEMDLGELVRWSDEVRRYLEAKTEAQRKANEQSG